MVGSNLLFTIYLPEKRAVPTRVFGLYFRVFFIDFFSAETKFFNGVGLICVGASALFIG
jgi:hypothetical protein